MSVYGFNVNPPDAWENYRSNPNRFMLDGMYAEEWKNAEKGRTFNQFWDKQKKVLLENSSNIFTDNLNIEKFSLDTLLNASMSTNTSDVKQILKSYSSWQHLDDIASGKANGNIFGFDLETFGDVYNKQGMFGITELGLSELKYKDNLFKIDKSVSLAIGITNEEAEYFHNLIGKVKKDGWSSLEQNEQVTLLRLSMYSGNFFDRFKNMELDSLGSHNSSDRSSKETGDIVVRNIKTKDIYEVVEVKFDIKPTHLMVDYAYDKIKYNNNVQRYYILSTAKPDLEELNKINDKIDEIYKEYGCQVIVNGIFDSLKYYLRLLTNSDEFLTCYTKNLQANEELDYEHKISWNRIVENRKDD